MPDNSNRVNNPITQEFIIPQEIINWTAAQKRINEICGLIKPAGSHFPLMQVVLQGH
jgi:hypothetical protein